MSSAVVKSGSIAGILTERRLVWTAIFYRFIAATTLHSIRTSHWSPPDSAAGKHRGYLLTIELHSWEVN